MIHRPIGTQFALKKMLLNLASPIVLIYKYGARIKNCNSHMIIVLNTGWKIKLMKTPENRLMVKDLKTAAAARM